MNRNYRFLVIIDRYGLWLLWTGGHFRPVLEWKTDDAAISCSMYFPKTWFSDLKHSSLRTFANLYFTSSEHFHPWLIPHVDSGLPTYFVILFMVFRISLWTNVAFARKWSRIQMLKVSHKSKYNSLFFSLAQNCDFTPSYSVTTLITSPFWVLLLHYDTPTCTPSVFLTWPK